MRLAPKTGLSGWIRVSRSVAVLAALGGCAHSPPPGPLAPKAELIGVRLFLDPKVELPLVSDGCVPYQKAWSGTLRNHIRVNLAKVGFDVTDDPTAPRDAVAKVSLIVSRCAGLVDVGEIWLAVLPGAPVTVDLGASNGPQPIDAENLVRKLIALPKVLSLKHRAAPPSSATVLAQTVATARGVPAATWPDAPPVTSFLRADPQTTAYALVIGIERYRDFPASVGARRDAESFATLLLTTLGLPQANIRIALDTYATDTDIERQLTWLKTHVPLDGRVYFFFRGYGASDVRRGGALLVPYNADPAAVEETSLPLADLLTALGATKAKETLAFVDACFSGAGGRSILPKGSPPVAQVMEVSRLNPSALFTAASGEQLCGTSQEGNGGAFTKYVLQAIGEAKADVNGDGQVTLDELATWVTPRVEQEAKQQRRAQTPMLMLGGTIGDPKSVAVAWGFR